MSIKFVNKKTDTKKAVWMDNFAFKLKKRMEYLELSQNELAKRSGISQMAISCYVNRKMAPTAYNLCRLATALITTPNDLTSFD